LPREWRITYERLLQLHQAGSREGVATRAQLIVLTDQLIGNALMLINN
jgi:hypothetical protein